MPDVQSESYTSSSQDATKMLYMGACIAMAVILGDAARSVDPPQPCVGNCTVVNTTTGAIEGIPARRGAKGAIHFLGVPFVSFHS